MTLLTPLEQIEAALARAEFLVRVEDARLTQDQKQTLRLIAALRVVVGQMSQANNDTDRQYIKEIALALTGKEGQ